jgi:hypothetical protein
MKPSLGLGLGEATPCILEHSNSTLLLEPLKVTISLELRAEVKSYTY